MYVGAKDRDCGVVRYEPDVLRRFERSGVGAEDKKKKKEEEDDDFDEDGEGLNAQQVEMLLNVLCEETELAEVELKMPGFKMKVRRSLEGLGSSAAEPAADPVVPVAAPAATVVAAQPDASTQAYTIDSDNEAESDFDGSLMAIQAPKVGVLRRGRYVKGKQVGKAPAVEEGATVKGGQVLCYIEQLGTFWPVESPQAGELISFLVEEGEAVEYQQEVAEIAPFFGGHIIGDSKHA